MLTISASPDVDGHTSFESFIPSISTGEPLAEYLRDNPQLVGKAVLDRYGPEIPFFTKIISFAKALKLQIHPDRTLAQRLHEQVPDRPGDVRRKPEIAIALSKFELLAGFKPLEDIRGLFRLRPLEQFVPSQSDFTNATLRQVCTNISSASPEDIASIIIELQSIPESQFGAYPYIPGLLCRLSKQDAGPDNETLLTTLLMNHIILGPGDALYVPEDSVHVYLEGDVIECMARSDSVISTGFCPAPRDDSELFKSLTFVPRGAETALLPRCKSDKGVHGKTDAYAPPSSEFTVLCTCLGAGEKESHKAIRGPSLVIVVKGHGAMQIPGNESVRLSEGYVFFVWTGRCTAFELR
ncbi:hypothetical protein N7468_002761 [Penicillium chermesinum]|uniref:Mannose-6-phosphate isomerase n=1 Tax=Penicillium chermesinum TaxID=63820 RepID=A0A9W9TYR9_9EURO|nr:uncharacterized protein N7468_002761 [Penicillium chermesinum]KAJ5247778.1 hypothetical protein N7468_002761 [Penicillium chermesinum]